MKPILTGTANETPAQAQQSTSSSDPLGQLFPLMALGGMNDKFFSNYLVLNMLGGGQNNLVRGGPLNGMNPLLLGPMLGMEMGLF